MLPIDYDPIALEGDALPPKHETLESADAALAFLVEQGMVVVTGDEIVVPASFWRPTEAADAEPPHPSN